MRGPSRRKQSPLSVLRSCHGLVSALAAASCGAVDHKAELSSSIAWPRGLSDQWIVGAR